MPEMLAEYLSFMTCDMPQPGNRTPAGQQARMKQLKLSKRFTVKIQKQIEYLDRDGSSMNVPVLMPAVLVYDQHRHIEFQLLPSLKDYAQLGGPHVSLAMTQAMEALGLNEEQLRAAYEPIVTAMRAMRAAKMFYSARIKSGKLKIDLNKPATSESW